ncbi:hypothetical protein JL720_1137 [Aureococcus anophagefferens]|nr:hypothetical protein JL720_1137 [Aureococcus anophagefferens]
MGSATSVVRKPLREQDADQLASALAHDQRLEEYAHVVRAKGLTGAMVSHMSADEVVKALDIADASLANHLGALLAYEKSAKAASEAHRATLEAAAGSPVKEDDAEHEMEGQLALMRQVRESMRNGDASDAHLAETAIGVSVEDTPREEEAQRVAPEPAAPTPSKRLSNAQLRSSALGGEGHTPRGGLRKEGEAPVVDTATLPPDAAHHARAMEVGDVADEASNLQHLKELASTREDSLVARIIDEVSGDYDGTDRDEFEALFKKYNLFQKAGMDELRGQLFAMFDRDGDGKVAVDELAWEADVVAAVGSDLNAAKIDTEQVTKTGRLSLVEFSQKEQKKKGKKKGGKKKKAAKGPPKPATVDVALDGAVGHFDIRVAKDELLKLQETGSNPALEQQLLDALVADCLKHNDRDDDGALSFDEFKGWAGGSTLVDELISHFHLFDAAGAPTPAQPAAPPADAADDETAGAAFPDLLYPPTSSPDAPAQSFDVVPGTKSRQTARCDDRPGAALICSFGERSRLARAGHKKVCKEIRARAEAPAAVAPLEVLRPAPDRADEIRAHRRGTRGGSRAREANPEREPESARFGGRCPICLDEWDSYKKAVKIFKRAVELGNVQATIELGYMYEKGRGVRLDLKKASQLYRMAADRG